MKSCSLVSWDRPPTKIFFEEKSFDAGVGAAWLDAGPVAKPEAAGGCGGMGAPPPGKGGAPAPRGGTIESASRGTAGFASTSLP